jgi:hypothetical protein
LHLIGAILIVGSLALAILVLFPSVQATTYAAMLVRSDRDAPIALPANCSRSEAAVADDMVSYLEKEQNSRGLIFKEWIVCREIPPGGFAFVNDPRWLPSYVPGTYQFRRTVIIVPVGPATPQGSPVFAEICRMPWRKYFSQVVGGLDGKYAVWK